MKSEQRLILALGLSFLLIAFYPYILKTFFPSLVHQPAKTEQQTPETKAFTPAPGASNTNTSFSNASSAQPQALRAPKFNADVEETRVDNYDVKISPAGALVQFLKLGDTTNGILINAQDGPGSFQVWLEGFEALSSGAIFERNRSVEKPGELVYQANLDSKIRMEKRYMFIPEKNAFILNLTFNNLTAQPIATRYELSSQIHFTEKSGYDHAYVEFNLNTPEKIYSKKVDKLKKEPYVYTGKTEWFSLSRKYLSVILKPESKFTPEEIRAKALSPDTMEAILKTQRFEIPAHGSASQDYLIYAGPNSYETLKSFGFGFQKILSKGFFGPLKIGMLLTLYWFYHWIPNYGVAIILLTVLIKILFSPLTHISFESMRRMHALQPKIKSLQAHYKADPQRMQKELMALYKKNKVNPLSGCLPMLLQMPIFIALYQALSQAVELRGASFFGWIHDLSQPDRLFTLPFSIPFLGDGINILPLIMMGSMVWQQKLTPSSGMDPQQEKMMQFMPIMFGFMFYNLPSGLVIYWTLSNFLTIAHQLIIKRIPFQLHPDTI
ncbi:MAG: membrane protein insertase YidC [Candidatus Omnitrophica bacterium]|nr:membrane protein insertase YidC [Candidatus Omnitrophota bacterium]